ncbi:AraC family transcriptional regulator [Mucilaginibacter sp. SP1R1]|uniref:AraC family transcriptional regulator n=1 Tax=Mucilaginibacter sp. SP1R1 TaxID=2723091 RepID=UPI00180AC5C3|nr:YesN/AraC family two-component response regulator [Mucilaginibacter sp. SP1R1]
MKLYVKNMVCNRCKMAVKTELEKAGIEPLGIELGEITLNTAPEAAQLEQLEKALNSLGFEVIDNQKSRLIEQIKTQIIKLVHYTEDATPLKLSAILTDSLHHDYSYLSNLFSAVEGTTIEKYYIAQKIEKAKELLIYNELSLSEIAYQMGYSSVAYLSAQFKQVTGMTPSQFKKLQGHKRQNLDDL